MSKQVITSKTKKDYVNHFFSKTRTLMSSKNDDVAQLPIYSNSICYIFYMMLHLFICLWMVCFNLTRYNESIVETAWSRGPIPTE